MTEPRTPPLPAHIEDSVRAIARLHTEHHERATALERTVDRITALLGRPAFLGALSLAILLWVGTNLALGWLGRDAFDRPPFPWLGDGLTLMALLMTALILITQRRADQLASHREQMTLELAILSEQKVAKIIELIEELRRDDPQIANRVDAEAFAMSTPADPRAVSEAIMESHDEADAATASAPGKPR